MLRRFRHRLHQLQDMEQSPFGKLLPELRLQIYELVLHRRKSLTVTRVERRQRLMPALEEPSDADQILALLLTCRATTQECRQLLYSLNTFGFDEVGMLIDFRRFFSDVNEAALGFVVVKLRWVEPKAWLGESVSHSIDAICDVWQIANRFPKSECRMRIEYTYGGSMWLPLERELSLEFDPRRLDSSIAEASMRVETMLTSAKDVEETRGLNKLLDMIDEVAFELEMKTGLTGLWEAAHTRKTAASIDWSWRMMTLGGDGIEA